MIFAAAVGVLEEPVVAAAFVVVGWLLAVVVGFTVGAGQSSFSECDEEAVEMRIEFVSLLPVVEGAEGVPVPSGIVMMPVSVVVGTVALPRLVPSGMVKMPVCDPD